MINVEYFQEIEKEQEAKLKAKYGMMKKPGGGSSLLQKRLQKGVSIVSYLTHPVVIYLTI